MGQGFGHAVKDIGDDPIKHLDQEGELLQDAAMDVVGETGRVGGIYDGPTALAGFWKVLGGLRSLGQVVFIIIPGH